MTQTESIHVGEKNVSVHPAALSLAGVSFAYPETGAADARMLSDVTVDVAEGSFTLLVGGTGSGKTTLMRLCKPEIAPVGTLSGQVRVFGRDVRGLDPVESAGLVGYVFQNPDNQIVCQTVVREMAFGMENLGVPEPEMRRRVAETCYFLGTEPWFRAQTAELSGGQRQLLALASTLVMRPRLLLLDEPCAMLDPIASKNLLALLWRINRELGVTVVVATHDPAALRHYATGAIVLEDGMARAAEVEDLLTRVDADAALFDAAMATDAMPGSEATPAWDTARAERVLTLDDVWFRHACDGHWVMRGTSLDLRRGEARALLGGNGSGKTTLLHLAAGVLAPQRGRVRNALARSQVLLPQSPKALLSLPTVEEELMEWAPTAGYARADMLALLAQVGMDDPALLARHPFDLSGGQQQLVALVKLLLTRPQLLLLDEPTKGLDLACRATVTRLLAQAKARGASILLATHDVAFAHALADTVSLVFDGQVTLTQPTREFLASSWVWGAGAEPLPGSSGLGGGL